MNSITLIRSIAGIIGCFLTTYYLIPFFIKNAERWNLMDKPSGRKKHLKVTPVVGGISLAIGIFLGLFISGLVQVAAMLPIFGALVILLATGVIDDRRGLSPLVKWLGQAGAAGIMIAGGFYMKSFHNVLGIPDLHAGIMIFFSLIFITGLINAVNLLDGMDGLVGGITGINVVVFGIIFFYRGQYGDATFAFMICAGLAAFLIFNFAPAKIFMGDGGSLFLGGILSYFFLRIWNTQSSTKEIYLAVSLISFPIFDMLRVFIQRIKNKNSPFSADRSHFHHYLTKTGVRHAIATLIMYILNMLLILQAILLNGFGLDKFIISNLLFFLLLFFIVQEHTDFYEKRLS